jgi:hypothetical protein
MWHAAPVGWLARTYRLTESGCELARLGFTWREQGEIELGERHLAVRREGLWRARFQLEEGGRRLASARAANAWGRGFLLEHGDETYRLEPASFLGRRYELTLRSRGLGAVRATSFFGREVEVALDEALAPELRLFAFWLVVHSWRRASAAAAGAG